MKRTVIAAALLAVLAGACAPAADSETAREETNKRNVIAFYEAAVNDKDYDKAAAYLGDDYIQHNPVAQDGKEGLRAFIGFLKSSFPEGRNEVKSAWADGDFVILHVHSVREPGTLGRAIVDIYRLDEAGKVVEHWDVIQDIPAQAANDNGMF